MDLINDNNNDFTPDNKPQILPVMFTDYPDVIGVPELAKMLGGISEKLARRLMREKIEHLEIGREYKTTKEDVITYIYKNKQGGNQNGNT